MLDGPPALSWVSVPGYFGAGAVSNVRLRLGRVILLNCIRHSYAVRDGVILFAMTAQSPLCRRKAVFNPFCSSFVQYGVSNM